MATIPFTFSPNTTIFSAEVNADFSEIFQAHNNHVDPPATSHPLGILLNNNTASVRFDDSASAGGDARAEIYQNDSNQLIFDSSNTVVGNADYRFFFTHTALEFRLFGDEPANGVFWYMPNNTDLRIRTSASVLTYTLFFNGAGTASGITVTTNCHFSPSADNTGSFGRSAPTIIRYNNNHTTDFYGAYNAGPDVADRLWPHPDYELPESELNEYTKVVGGKRKFKSKKKVKPGAHDPNEEFDYDDMRSTDDSLSTLEKGTVLVWKDDQTGTGYAPSATENDTKLVGVISTKPGVKCGSLYSDEDDIIGDHVCLKGRIPCRVKGEVDAGDMLTTGADGCAVKATSPTLGSIVGKALESKTGSSEQTIMIWV